MKKILAILVAVFMMSGFSSCILVDPDYHHRHDRGWEHKDGHHDGDHDKDRDRDRDHDGDRHHY